MGQVDGEQRQAPGIGAPPTRARVGERVTRTLDEQLKGRTPTRDVEVARDQIRRLATQFLDRAHEGAHRHVARQRGLAGEVDGVDT